MARGGYHTRSLCIALPEHEHAGTRLGCRLGDAGQSGDSAGRSQFERQLCSGQGQPNSRSQRDPDFCPSSAGISASGQPESAHRPCRQDRYKIPIPRDRSLDRYESWPVCLQPNRSCSSIFMPAMISPGLARSPDARHAECREELVFTIFLPIVNYFQMASPALCTAKTGAGAIEVHETLVSQSRAAVCGTRPGCPRV